VSRYRTVKQRLTICLATSTQRVSVTNGRTDKQNCHCTYRACAYFWTTKWIIMIYTYKW